MAEGDARNSKRSRFDQTEPEPKRSSRFDRRSRSPTRYSESKRSRSPINRDRNGPLSPSGSDGKSRTGHDAAAAAGKRTLCALVHLGLRLTFLQLPQRPGSMPQFKQRKAYSTSMCLRLSRLVLCPDLTREALTICRLQVQWQKLLLLRRPLTRARTTSTERCISLMVIT